MKQVLLNTIVIVVGKLKVCWDTVYFAETKKLLLKVL